MLETSQPLRPAGMDCGNYNVAYGREPGGGPATASISPSVASARTGAVATCDLLIRRQPGHPHAGSGAAPVAATVSPLPLTS